MGRLYFTFTLLLHLYLNSKACSNFEQVGGGPLRRAPPYHGIWNISLHHWQEQQKEPREGSSRESKEMAESQNRAGRALPPPPPLPRPRFEPIDREKVTLPFPFPFPFPSSFYVCHFESLPPVNLESQSISVGYEKFPTFKRNRCGLHMNAGWNLSGGTPDRYSSLSWTYAIHTLFLSFSLGFETGLGAILCSTVGFGSRWNWKNTSLGCWFLLVFQPQNSCYWYTWRNCIMGLFFLAFSSCPNWWIEKKRKPNSCFLTA